MQNTKEKKYQNALQILKKLGFDDLVPTTNDQFEEMFGEIVINPPVLLDLANFNRMYLQMVDIIYHLLILILQNKYDLTNLIRTKEASKLTVGEIISKGPSGPSVFEMVASSFLNSYFEALHTKGHEGNLNQQKKDIGIDTLLIFRSSPESHTYAAEKGARKLMSLLEKLNISLVDQVRSVLAVLIYIITIRRE